MTEQTDAAEAGRGYCQQEHHEGDVTYWCELRERHTGPHRSDGYEWPRGEGGRS